MRWILLASGLILSLLVSGIIFGFQALKPLLIADGAFADECHNGNCNNQILKLNWIFSMCSTLTNISAFAIGIILDSCGPVITVGIGSLVFSAGCLCLSFATIVEELYLIGFALLSISGPTVFIGLLSQARLFKNREGMVMAAYTGCFDASTIIFFVFQVGSSYFHAK